MKDAELDRIFRVSRPKVIDLALAYSARVESACSLAERYWKQGRPHSHVIRMLRATAPDVAETVSGLS